MSEDDREDAPRSGRGWKIAAVVAVIAAAISLGVLASLLLFGGSDSPDADVRACIPVRDFTKEGAGKRAKGPTCPPTGATKTVGIVQKEIDGGFTMRTSRGDRVIRLHVREPDRPYIDVAHAQSHAALGQPVQVYTLRIDGRDSVVYMDDPKPGF